MLARVSQSAWNNISVVVVCAVLTVSVGLSLTLALKYRAATTPHSVGIKVGATIKRIPALASDGRRQDVVLDGKHWTVLYVMAPGCHWCARNLENIRALASHSAGSFRFIGLSNTAKDLAHYVASTPLPFSVQAVDLEHVPEGLNTITTPQLALVRPDGRVEKVWIGALGGSDQAEVEQFFHVKLPGMAETTTGAQ